MAQTMTNQEMFDKAWRGAKAQGFQKAVHEGDSLWEGSCAYRAQDGLRCHFGHCIPDDLYVEEFECTTAVGVCIKLEWWDVDEGFVTALQEAHDDALCPLEVEENTRRLAADYGLTIPE